MKGHRRVTLEDVLNDYVASSPEPSYGALEDWVRRYPQYEQELTEFTISWGLMEWLSPSSDTEEVDDETLVLHGMSIVQNLLHQKRQKGSSDDAVPITSLLEEGSKLGLSIENLADLSNLSILIIKMLDRCLIRYKSIPGKAIQYIAQTIQRSPSVIELYLQSEPKPMRAVYYRANQRPVLGEQQDFFEVVQTDSTMSEERRRYWLALKSNRE